MTNAELERAIVGAEVRYAFACDAMRDAVQFAALAGRGVDLAFWRDAWEAKRVMRGAPTAPADDERTN